jgi:hypothetical protein
MQIHNAVCVELIRQLGRLDETFGRDYAEDLEQVEEYPHGVMSLFAGYLSRQYANYSENHQRLVDSAMAIIENNLHLHYDAVQNLVEVSFVECVFYDNMSLFLYIANHAEHLLKYEFFAFQTKELGYRVINAVREVFGQTLFESPSSILANQEFLDKLTALGVDIVHNKVLDPWRQSFSFEVCAPKDNTTLVRLTSLASLRGHGKDIEILG